MSIHPILRHGAAGTALAAALALGLTAMPAAPAAAAAKTRRVAPAATAPVSAPVNVHRELDASLPAASAASVSGGVLQLSTSQGQMITLPRAMTDLFVADPNIADVQVRSPTALYVFGKKPGETTVSATGKDGRTIFTTTVRVGQNVNGISQMLKVAMPDAQITATPMNGVVVLTGTVAAPDDVEQANRLVTAFVGKDIQIVSRLKTATPLQVMLRVRFAEVNREFSKNIGFNMINTGSHVGIYQGNLNLDSTPQKIIKGAAGTSLLFSGAVAGMNILSSLDLAEANNLATTLAQPSLTALSGETASFLAGGEIPIPVPQYQGVTTIDYKQYGVSLAFTPTVLGDGRISLRVRPEVSQLTASTVTINGYSIPGLTTRRAETTVELGSGQSYVIGGLLSNTASNSVDKAPFLGDLPVLGQLFRSNGWKRSESELVIVVTPYLVRPVSDSKIALPTDGYRLGTDAQQILLDKGWDGQNGKGHPNPKANPPVTATAPQPRKDAADAAAPGFSIQ
jgi:pilus assembly protein CpaC